MDNQIYYYCLNIGCECHTVNATNPNQEARQGDSSNELQGGEKCNECQHGRCKVCTWCHNPDCFNLIRPTNDCYNQLLPKSTQSQGDIDKALDKFETAVEKLESQGEEWVDELWIELENGGLVCSIKNCGDSGCAIQPVINRIRSLLQARDEEYEKALDILFKKHQAELKARDEELLKEIQTDLRWLGSVEDFAAMIHRRKQLIKKYDR